MGIVVNEFSIDNQYKTKEEFADNLKDLVYCIELLKNFDINFLFLSTIYNTKVVNGKSLVEIINKPDLYIFTKFKSLLMNSCLFWDGDKKHNKIDKYVCEFTEMTTGYSLAEACERRKEVFSFKHNNFNIQQLYIHKNDAEILLENFQNFNNILDSFYERNFFKNNELLYCKFKFSNNMNFDQLDPKYGFSTLEKEQINSYINTFKMFNNMTWTNIRESVGLDYKRYFGSWFQNSDYKSKIIMKFRTSLSYRCYGYEEDNKFIVLRFDTTHKISDKG